MNVSIIYSTQMGSTQMIADLIAQELRSLGHEAQEVHATTATVDTVKAAGAVVFAFPTYDDGLVEGMARPLVDALAAASGIAVKYGMIAPGDKNYPHFCGAVEVVEAAASKAGMTQVVPTLKLDNYMMNMATANEEIKAWVGQLAAGL